MPNSISYPAEEFRQISGITRVEEVSGVYDFLIEIDTTAHFTRISDILMSKPWVKRVHVLKPIRTVYTQSGNSRIIEPTTHTEEKTAENNQTPTQSRLYPII